jgi:hypothetical protein
MVAIPAEVMGGYCPLLEAPKVVSRVANAARTWWSRTPARLYVYHPLLQRLPQHLQDMPAELGEFIQKQHAIMGERYLTRHRHVAATN